MRVNRRVVANVAIFAVAFVVMVAWAFSQVVSVDQIDRPYRVAADFSNAFGITPNAEVTYLGVSYGSVTSIHLVPSGVRIRMQIDRGKRIPAGATAAIGRKSAVGEPYVDFEPPAGYHGEGGPYLEAGAVVPRSRTQVPLEFSELLRSASALIESIPPQDVHDLIHELAAGLNGRSDDLRRLNDANDQLAATFAAKTDVLDRLATNNTRLTHVVTDHRESLGSSLTNLRQLAATLKASKGDTSQFLDKGSPLLTQLADLVAAEKGNLDCTLKDLEVVIDATTTPRREDELAALLRFGPKAYAGLWDSVDEGSDGPWLRVGNISNSTNPPAQYVPRKTLPPVAQVPACTSPLRPTPTAQGYRPGSPLPQTRSGSGGPVPLHGAAGTFGAISLGAVVLLASRRIRPLAPGRLRSLG